MSDLLFPGVTVKAHGEQRAQAARAFEAARLARVDHDAAVKLRVGTLVDHVVLAGLAGAARRVLGASALMGLDGLAIQGGMAPTLEGAQVGSCFARHTSAPYPTSNPRKATNAHGYSDAHERDDLPVGVHGRFLDRGFGFGRANHLPRHVGAEVFAANDAVCGALDLWATLGWHISRGAAPLIDGRWRDLEDAGQLSLPADFLASSDDGGFNLAHGEHCSTASCARKASLHKMPYSIAFMTRIWSTDEEAERLAERFKGVNQAEFARRFEVPGGPSMLSQHIKGRRPMNMDAALAYMKGFGVRLDEISPRLAKQMYDSLRELEEAAKKRPDENVASLAQPLSQSAGEDAPTAAEVGSRQPPVSFDEAFAKMRPSEQKRFLFLWAAAFDDPPDPTGHIGGIPKWNQSTSAPGASPGKTAPAKKAPGKDKHRRLG